MSIESVKPSNHLILCHPLLLLPSIFPSIRVFFLRNQFFASGGQSIWVSASASVLPMNIQDLFPLRLTLLISLQSKGLSRILSNTTVQKHQFLMSFSGPFNLASDGLSAALPLISNCSNLSFGMHERSPKLDSCLQQMGTKMFPCPGASQGLAWSQVKKVKW